VGYRDFLYPYPFVWDPAQTGRRLTISKSVDFKVPVRASVVPWLNPQAANRKQDAALGNNFLVVESQKTYKKPKKNRNVILLSFVGPVLFFSAGADSP